MAAIEERMASSICTGPTGAGDVAFHGDDGQTDESSEEHVIEIDCDFV